MTHGDFMEPVVPAVSVSDENESLILESIKEKWQELIPKFVGFSSDKMISVRIPKSFTDVVNTPVFEEDDEVDTNTPLMGNWNVIENISCTEFQSFLSKVSLQDPKDDPRERIRGFLTRKDQRISVYIRDDMEKWGLTNGNGGCGSYAIASMVLKTFPIDNLHITGSSLNTHLNIDSPIARKFVTVLFKVILLNIPVRLGLAIACGQCSIVTELKRNIKGLLDFLEQYQEGKKKLEGKYWMASPTLQLICSSVNKFLRVTVQDERSMNVVYCVADEKDKDGSDYLCQVQQTSNSSNHDRNSWAERSYDHWKSSLPSGLFITNDTCHYFESQFQNTDDRDVATCLLDGPIDNLVDKIVTELEALHRNLFLPVILSPRPAVTLQEHIQTVTCLLGEDEVLLVQEHIQTVIYYLEGYLNKFSNPEKKLLDIPRSLGNNTNGVDNICWLISCTNVFANSEAVKKFLQVLSERNDTPQPFYKKNNKKLEILKLANTVGVPFQSFPEAYEVLLRELQKGRTYSQDVITIKSVVNAFMKDRIQYHEDNHVGMQKLNKNDTYSAIDGIQEIFGIWPRLAEIYQYTLNSGWLCTTCNVFLYEELFATSRTENVYNISTLTSSMLQNIEISLEFPIEHERLGLCCNSCSNGNIVRRHFMEKPSQCFVIAHNPATDYVNKVSIIGKIEQSIPHLIRFPCGPKTEDMKNGHVYYRLESVSHIVEEHFVTEIKCGDGINDVKSVILNDDKLDFSKYMKKSKLKITPQDSIFSTHGMPAFCVYEQIKVDDFGLISQEYDATVIADAICKKEVDDNRTLKEAQDLIDIMMAKAAPTKVLKIRDLLQCFLDTKDQPYLTGLGHGSAGEQGKFVTKEKDLLVTILVTHVKNVIENTYDFMLELLEETVTGIDDKMIKECILSVLKFMKQYKLSSTCRLFIKPYNLLANSYSNTMQDIGFTLQKFDGFETQRYAIIFSKLEI